VEREAYATEEYAPDRTEAQLSDDPDMDGLGLTQPATTEERLNLLERWSRSHARSIGEITDVVGRQGVKLEAIEKWQMERLVAEAREEERDKALYARLDRIDANINSMRGVWTRIMWIAAGTVVPAVVAGVALLLVFGANLVFGGIPR
jgi:hypothetical protein